MTSFSNQPNSQNTNSSEIPAPAEPAVPVTGRAMSWGDLIRVPSARDIFAHESRLAAHEENWTPQLQRSSEDKLIEGRFLHVVESQGLDAVAGIARPDLVKILQHSEYADSVLHVSKLLGHPQTSQEIAAYIDLLAVNRTPTLAAVVHAYASEAIMTFREGPNYWYLRDIESPTQVAIPERRGPKIWSDIENVPVGDTLCPPGARLNYADSRDAEANRERVKEILTTITSALSGKPEATTAIVRLAINLESEEKGLKPGDQFVAQILANAFPHELRRMDAGSSDSTRHFQLVEGEKLPQSPSGLDSRERKLFKAMLAKYVESKQA